MGEITTAATKEKWTPTSHNPTHLSFARLGPSSPSDVPLRYTTTSCHPSLGASPTPVGQGGAKHKSSGRTSHLVLPEKGRWIAATKPHPSTSSKAIILKDGPTFTRRRRFPAFIPTPGENTHIPFFAMDKRKEKRRKPTTNSNQTPRGKHHKSEAIESQKKEKGKKRERES